MPTEQEIHDMFEPTVDNVMRNVKMSRRVFLTKDGKLYSGIAEQYIRGLEQYAKFCREGKQELWMETVRRSVYSVGCIGVEDEKARNLLIATENAGKLMEAKANNMSNKNIKKFIESIPHDENSMVRIYAVLDSFGEFGIGVDIFEIEQALIKSLKKKESKKGEQQQS